MTDHTSTDDDRLACIKDITTLFGKLEIEDCRSLVKKAMEMIESTPVSKAVKDALISAGLKNVQLLGHCKWTYGECKDYKAFQPELSFMAKRSLISQAKHRVVVVEIDECLHEASSYVNPYGLTFEYYRNFVYLHQTLQYCKETYSVDDALVDIIRAGFCVRRVKKDSDEDKQMIEDLKDYVLQLLEEDTQATMGTIRFWNYTKKDVNKTNVHIEYWDNKKVAHLNFDNRKITAAFELSDIDLKNVKLQSEEGN